MSAMASEAEDRDAMLAACGFAFTLEKDAPSVVDRWARCAQVQAQLCERPIQATLSELGPLSDLDLGEFGAYRIDVERSRIWIRRTAAQPLWQSEALRGPILLHALASHGVYALHASAIQRPGLPLIALTAASGTGKSTLAAVAARLGWRRVGDDLLPVAHIGGRMVALPHLPQPKLAADQQYPADAPSHVAIAALLRLDRGERARFKRLDASAAAQLVLTSTVATRVFAQRSLAAHLGFAAAFAHDVATGQLLAGELTVAERPDDVTGAVNEALTLLQSVLTPPRIPPLA